MTNTHNTTLYLGVTSNLEKRVWEHKGGINKNSFAFKYNCNKLVYFETFGDIELAIEREKQVKKWRRKWEEELIGKDNPDWVDLAESWGYG
jgi:putative endonuclease